MLFRSPTAVATPAFPEALQALYDACSAVSSGAAAALRKCLPSYAAVHPRDFVDGEAYFAAQRRAIDLLLRGAAKEFDFLPQLVLKMQSTKGCAVPSTSAHLVIVRQLTRAGLFVRTEPAKCACKGAAKECYTLSVDFDGAFAVLAARTRAAAKRLRDEAQMQAYATQACGECKASWSMFDARPCVDCTSAPVAPVETSPLLVQADALEAMAAAVQAAFDELAPARRCALEHTLSVRQGPRSWPDEAAATTLPWEQRDQPADAGYAYRAEDCLASYVDLELRDAGVLRDYQRECVEAFFRGGRVQSGYAMMPCGSGKTLTMATIMATLRRACMVVCPNEEAAVQFKAQLVRWTTINPIQVVLLTANHRPPAWFLRREGGVRHLGVIFITTYSMYSQELERVVEPAAPLGVGCKRKAADDAGQDDDDAVAEQPAAKRRRRNDAVSRVLRAGGGPAAGRAETWRQAFRSFCVAAVIFDEVHMLPTATRNGIVDKVRGSQLARGDPRRPAMIGFTASYRLDKGLRQNARKLLGGDMVYHCDLQRLQRDGRIATVDVRRILLPPGGESLFPGHKDTFLSRVATVERFHAVVNMVTRYRECFEEARIFVIIERLEALERLRHAIPNSRVIKGDVKPAQRAEIYEWFDRTPGAVLIVSKVGEVAMDTVKASFMIHVSAMDHAVPLQYIGRIQRSSSTKPDNMSLYVQLAERGGDEQKYSQARLDGLRDEGYSCKTMNAGRGLCDGSLRFEKSG